MAAGILSGLLGFAVALVDFSARPFASVLLLLISLNLVIGTWRHDRVELIDVVSGVLVVLASAEFIRAWAMEF